MLMEDMWTLVSSIRSGNTVPRVLLKNGKRSKGEWQLSQVKQREKRSELNEERVGDEDQNSDESGGVETVNCGDVGRNADDGRMLGCEMSSVLMPGDVAFKARLLREMSEIKDGIDVLRLEVYSLKDAALNSHDVGVEMCNIYVGVRIDLSEEVGKSWLETVLGCKVESFWKLKGLPRPAFKAKIKKAYFHDVVLSGQKNHCLVAVWRALGNRDVGSCAGVGSKIGHSELSTGVWCVYCP